MNKAGETFNEPPEPFCDMKDQWETLKEGEVLASTLRPRAARAGPDVGRLRQDSPPAVRFGDAREDTGSICNFDHLIVSYFAACHTAIQKKHSSSSSSSLNIRRAQSARSFSLARALRRHAWLISTILILPPQRYDVDPSTGWQEAARVALSRTGLSYQRTYVARGIRYYCSRDACLLLVYVVLLCAARSAMNTPSPRFASGKTVNIDCGLEDTMSIDPLVGERLLFSSMFGSSYRSTRI